MKDILISIISGCFVSILVFLGIPLLNFYAPILLLVAMAIWLICRIKLKSIIPFMLTNIVITAATVCYWKTIKSWETMFLPALTGWVDAFFILDIICYLLYRLIKKIRPKVTGSDAMPPSLEDQ